MADNSRSTRSPKPINLNTGQLASDFGTATGLMVKTVRSASASSTYANCSSPPSISSVERSQPPVTPPAWFKVDPRSDSPFPMKPPNDKKD
ncbi:unnamed protein product, partial [Mesorhabditis spiculigera]